MTKTSKHTPGPWQSDESETYYRGYVIRNNGMVVCRLLDLGYPSHGSREANARLIAKAPELLAVVRAIADGQSTGPNVRVLLAEIDGEEAK